MFNFYVALSIHDERRREPIIICKLIYVTINLALTWPTFISLGNLAGGEIENHLNLCRIVLTNDFETKVTRSGTRVQCTWV
jgi:hypothetical protein